MEGNAVLDVEHFPKISYRSTAYNQNRGRSLGGDRSGSMRRAKLINRDPFTEARVKPAPQQRRVFFHTL
jgi:hypothetical protein